MSEKKEEPKRIFITLGQCLAMIKSMNELDAEFFMFYEDTISQDLNDICPYTMVAYKDELN